jgi:guanine deaminase
MAGNLYLPDRARQFEDPQHAANVAEFFLDELLRATAPPPPGLLHRAPGIGGRLLRSASAARNLRMIAGKVLMDRNCPDFLSDTAPACATAKS